MVHAAWRYRPSGAPRVWTPLWWWLALLHVGGDVLLVLAARGRAVLRIVAAPRVRIDRSGSHGIAVGILARGGSRRWHPLHAGRRRRHGLCSAWIPHVRRHRGGRHGLGPSRRRSGAEDVGEGGISLVIVGIAVTTARWPALGLSARVISVFGHVDENL